MVSAAVTARPFVDLDAVADRHAEVDGVWPDSGPASPPSDAAPLKSSGEPARSHAVARAVDDHPGAIVALGAGHTCYADLHQFATVRAALQHSPNVIRLLPSPDRETSLDVLRHRCTTSKNRSWIVDGHDFLAQWLDDPGAEPALDANRLHPCRDSPLDRSAAGP